MVARSPRQSIAKSVFCHAKGRVQHPERPAQAEIFEPIESNEKTRNVVNARTATEGVHPYGIPAD